MAVVIGRFQPMHLMHEHLLKQAAEVGKEVLVLVGSAFSSRSIKNPFTYEERKAMILKVLPSAIVRPVVDYMYDDDKWIAQVQKIVNGICQEVIGEYNQPTVCLVGHKKDSSSFYLNLFPSWCFKDVAPSRQLDATHIRTFLFGCKISSDLYAQNYIKSMVSNDVWEYLSFFFTTPEYTNLVEESCMIAKYKQSWAAAPYAPTFVTTDAIVTCAGHVLMIRRKFSPGKGLLALPGGFLNQNETIVQCVVRELEEETSINLGAAFLNSMIRTIKVFDHPNRSLRGRTITHAAHIPLGFTQLPEVKASDDAEEAMWVPFNDLKLNRSFVFEDHLDLINSLCGLDL